MQIEFSVAFCVKPTPVFFNLSDVSLTRGSERGETGKEGNGASVVAERRTAAGSA
jgi:hypothetical protein